MQAYRKSLGDGSTSFVLSPDSEFFRFFDGAARGRAGQAVGGRRLEPRRTGAVRPGSAVDACPVSRVGARLPRVRRSRRWRARPAACSHHDRSRYRSGAGPRHRGHALGLVPRRDEARGGPRGAARPRRPCGWAGSPSSSLGVGLVWLIRGIEPAIVATLASLPTLDDDPWAIGRGFGACENENRRYARARAAGRLPAAVRASATEESR